MGEEPFEVIVSTRGGVSPMGRYTHYNRNENTITISSYGAAGYVGFQTEKFWANDVCLCVSPKDVISNKYLYYALKKEQDYLYSKTTKAIPDHIPTEVILDLKIPVPPLPVQKRGKNNILGIYIQSYTKIFRYQGRSIPTAPILC